MNIIEKMKSILEEYPKIGTLHIDYNLNDADSFGLYSTGDRKVSEDVIGGQERQHTFVLYAAFQSFNDYDRLTNSGLLLDLQLWLESYANDQELTTVISGREHAGMLKNISCANGMLFNIPDNNMNAAVQYPMLYTGFEEIENYISEAVSQTYDMWFAHWARSCGYKGDNLSMWQYGGETNLIESNSIPGVGVIDKDLCYKDYPTIIKDGGFNGWGGEPIVGHGLTAAQAMSGARNLVGKDEDPDKCDIMVWYGGFDTDINKVACCCAGMFYLFHKLGALDLIPGGKVADCGSLALNFYNAGQLYKPDEVKPGDLVIFSWSGNRTSVQPLRDLGFKSFDHVEMVLKVFDNTILSVGANNGGIECDDFQIKTRKRSDISACCRPKYADSGEEDTAATVTEAVYGDRDVYEVQKWLNSHFGFDIYIDGVYGPQTRAALVMALQTVLNRDYGADLEVDGIYGRLTRKAVVNLERGAYGDYVKVLQGFLICMGYDTGGFDGDFGGRTEESVKTFQTVRDLYVDGIAGRNTFEELAKG